MTSIRVFTLMALAGAALLADEHNYYVHFTATNMTPGWITVDSMDGTPLVPPAEACGMKFEGASATNFEFFYGEEEVEADNPEVYLGTCESAGVRIVGEGMPSGLDGAISVDNARGYWIDKNGEKLIYKHSCAPHCAALNLGFRAAGFHYAEDVFAGLKRSLAGKKTKFPQASLLVSAEKQLAELSQRLPAAITARRALVAGPLERSVRAQEDEAQAQLQSASAQFGDCRTYRSRGDLQSAVAACDGAAEALRAAEAALAVSELWVELE